LASDQHDYDQAAQFFVASMALGQVGGEVAGQTDVLLNAARQARTAGEYQRATAVLEQALAWHRAQGHASAIGRVTLTPELHAFGQLLREFGLVTREQGDFGRATALFEESLAFHRAVDDRACMALAWIGLADIARDQGDSTQVQAYGEAALAILRELGMQWAIGFTLNTLALGAYYAGDLARALRLIRESEALFRDLNADGGLAEILITVGKIERARGDRVAASAALTEALRLAQATGPRLFVAASMEELAGLAAVQGQANQAAQLLAVASALRLHMGAPVWPADQSTFDSALSASRTMLGDDAFTAVWAQIHALSLEHLLSAIPSA
jgi:tetratricopeptide (TPR) repeat protein